MYELPNVEIKKKSVMLYKFCKNCKKNCPININGKEL